MLAHSAVSAVKMPRTPDAEGQFGSTVRSIAIAAAMILMLAAIFRQVSSLQRRTSTRASAGRVARQVFDQIARDLSGLSRRGFLMIRTQSSRGKYNTSDPCQRQGQG